MAWELPSSITRSLDRFAISRVQRLEGEDSILPIVQMLSLDQPPFRKAGYRFFGNGAIQADATGGCVQLSTSSSRCVVVVDAITFVVEPTAYVLVSIGLGGGSGIVPVFVPESGLRALPQSDATMTQRLGQFGGSTLYEFNALANSPVILPTQVVLLAPDANVGGAMSIACTVAVNLVVLRVSYSGRIWYSEE